MILGNSTGLSGFWVIFSITVFGGLWGIVGMFLGVPIFACIYAWARRRIRQSLQKKNLSNNTSEYIDAIHLNSDNTIKYAEEKESVPETTYIILQDNNTEVKEGILNKLKGFFANLWDIIIKKIKKKK